MHRRLFLFSAVPAVLLLAAPLAAHAAVPFFGPIIPADSATCPGGFALVMTVVNNIISFLLTIAIVFVAPLMIAYAGFLFVVNPVNESGKTQAKHILWNTVIGIVIALASWTIVDAVMVVLYNPNAQNGQTRLGVWSSLVSGGGDVCIQLAGSLSQAQPPPPTTTGVTPGAPTGAFSIPAAVRYADGNAQLSSTGQCALYVREALSAGGLSSFDTNHPEFAYQYGSYLTAAGFQTVSASGYAPLAGDVVVFQPVAGHPSGHIAIYDGSQWVSDFKQNSMYPAAAYQGGSYTVYRWPQTVAGPQAPVQCPPSQGTEGTLSSGTATAVRPSSGVITYYQIPAPLPGEAGVRYEQSESPSTIPGGIHTELSVSQCKGVIDSSVPDCYKSTDYTTDNRLDIYEKPANGWNSQAQFQGRGCWAPEEQGPWYLNVRFTYPSCPFADGLCGFVAQWLSAAYKADTTTAAAPQCPAPPAGMQKGTFQGYGQWQAYLEKSDQVVSFELPSVPTGHYSGQIAMGENAGASSPQPVTVYGSISQCPGIISTDTSNKCNFVSPNGSYNQLTWFSRPYQTINSGASAGQNGYCWAPETSGKWYFNVKWTYAACPNGVAACGFAIQQNPGPY